MRLRVITAYQSATRNLPAGSDVEVTEAEAEFLLRDSESSFELVRERRSEPDQGAPEPGAGKGKGKQNAAQQRAQDGAL